MPTITIRPTVDVRPPLGHVNLMVDTLIANLSPDDLRATVRGLLATSSPTVTASFTSSARTRLRHTHSKALPIRYAMFAIRPSDGMVVPTPHFRDVLARARCLYGSGMGFTSLKLLAMVVKATVGIQWRNDSDMADALTTVDTDISQAIQSSKEELDAGRISDRMTAHEVVRELQLAVNESYQDVKSWGGEFPFERAVASIAYWKDY